jgi:hypothetical protein
VIYWFEAFAFKCNLYYLHHGRHGGRGDEAVWDVGGSRGGGGMEGGGGGWDHHHHHRCGSGGGGGGDGCGVDTSQHAAAVGAGAAAALDPAASAAGRKLAINMFTTLPAAPVRRIAAGVKRTAAAAGGGSTSRRKRSAVLPPLFHVELEDHAGFTCGFEQCSNTVFQTAAGLKVHITTIHRDDPRNKQFNLVSEATAAANAAAAAAAHMAGRGGGIRGGGRGSGRCGMKRDARNANLDTQGGLHDLKRQHAKSAAAIARQDVTNERSLRLKAESATTDAINATERSDA